MSWRGITPVMAVLIAMSCNSLAVAGDLPDLNKTPGVARADLSKAQICSTKWGRDERHVTEAMKQQVFALYGYSGYHDSHCVPDAHGKTCEIDHLISRELGGADVVKNLWPEAYGTSPWNAHLKDKLENRLHNEVCAGHISLTQGRSMITHDWRVAYKHYYGNP